MFPMKYKIKSAFKKYKMFSMHVYLESPSLIKQSTLTMKVQTKIAI